MVKRLRHHPFTVVTWVQVPLGSPSANKSEHLCLGLFFILLSVFFKYFPRSEFLIRFCGLPDRQAVFIATDDYSDSLKIVLSAPMRGES